MNVIVVRPYLGYIGLVLKIVDVLYIISFTGDPEDVFHQLAIMLLGTTKISTCYFPDHQLAGRNTI